MRRAADTDIADGSLLGLGQCTQSCQPGEINIAENDWYYVENPGGGSPDANCKLGTEASYCCKTQVQYILSFPLGVYRR